jgi:hypothetical protein
MGYFHVDIDSPHAGLEIAAGQSKNLTAVNVFGFNRTIATDFETIWEYGGAYSFPTSSATLSLVSSSASDTMSVLVSGLNSDYEEIYDVVTLQGATPVTTTNEFFRVNSTVILAGSNAGNITVTHGSDVVSYIGAEIGISQQCVYTVPADKQLYLFRISLTSGTVNPNKYIIYRNVVTNSSGRTLRVAEATFQNNQQNFDRQIPFRLDSKTDFSFEAKSSSGDNELSIFVETVLMKPEN